MKYSENYVKRLKGRIRNLGEKISDYNNQILSIEHFVRNSDGKLHSMPVMGSNSLIGNEEFHAIELTVDQLRNMVLLKLESVRS